MTRSAWTWCSRASGRPTAPFNGKRGYHLNGLVSLFPPKRGYKTRLHQAVAQFLDAKHRSASKVAEKLGLTRSSQKRGKLYGDTVDSSPLLARCEPYAAKVPQDAIVLTAGVRLSG